MEAPGFWDNPEISNQKMKELKNLQDSVKAMHDLETQYEDIETLIEMGNEANDEEMAEEIREELDSFIETFEEIRIGTLLSEEYDSDNIVCTQDGQSVRTSQLKCWITWMVMRQESSP